MDWQPREIRPPDRGGEETAADGHGRGAPCDETSLKGAVEAGAAGLIKPILVGPKSRIVAIAKEFSISLGNIEIVDVPHSQAAAAKAVELVRTGEADLLMKGSLHTDELLSEVMKRDTGLRTGRRVSHVFVMDVPGTRKPVHHRCSGEHRARSRLQARHHPKRHRSLYRPRPGHSQGCYPVRGRDRDADNSLHHRGGGPLQDGGPRPDYRRPARRSACLRQCHQPEAASIKGIKSPVAGQAQILVVPDLEAGNMLAKNLTFLSHADAAGIVLGARVPIILTSRADHLRTRMASCAVAACSATVKWRSSRSRPEPCPRPSSSSMPAAQASSFSSSRSVQAIS